MSVFYQPIFTQTVANSSSVTSVTFNNIPQTFTDIKVVVSYKDTQTTNGSYVLGNVNSNYSSIYSDTVIYQSFTDFGTSVVSSRDVNIPYFFFTRTPTSNTSFWGANVFNNTEMYFSNYTSSTFKSYSTDVCNPSNTGTAYSTNIIAGLISTTSPITKLEFFVAAGFMAQGATFSLYGITRG